MWFVSLQGELLALRKDCCGEGLMAEDVSVIVQEKVEKVGMMRGWQTSLCCHH